MLTVLIMIILVVFICSKFLKDLTGGVSSLSKYARDKTEQLNNIEDPEERKAVAKKTEKDIIIVAFIAFIVFRLFLLMF